MLKRYAQIFNILQRSSDLIAVALGWFLAYMIRFEFMSGGQPGLEDFFFKMGLVLMAASAVLFHRYGLYRSQRFNSKLNEILTVLKANSLGFLTLIIVLYFLAPERVSRIHLVIYFIISNFLVVANRILVRNLLRGLRKKGHNLRHVVLLGNGRHLQDYILATQKFKDCGIEITGWIDSEGLAKEFEINDLGNWQDYTIEKLQEQNLDTLIIGYKGGNSDRLENFLKENYNNLIPIKIIPDLSYSYIGHHIEDFAGIPLLSVNKPSFSSFDLFLKRTFDFTLTLIGMLIISPLLLLLAILVRLSSPGPIFYGQERMGLDGQLFKMWKFRSMRVATKNEDEIEWSNKENPRKTKTGDFMRKTSLDELPQLWNVLVGDMSLVGPRPERPFFVEKFRHEIPGYMLRHKMKAGITGWAQVNGWRGDTSLNKRIECDIFYIKNWSFWLDMKILVLTFVKGFVNPNAY